MLPSPLLPRLRDRLLAAAAFAKINILLLPRKQVTCTAALLGFVFLRGRTHASQGGLCIIRRVAKAKQGAEGEPGRREWHLGAG